MRNKKRFTNDARVVWTTCAAFAAWGMAAFAAVPNIDTGRQLFVDDTLVDRLDGVVRRYHYPVKYAGNPVLKAETKFEIPEPPLNRVTLPKGGGLWWDAKANVFKLWYEVGWCGVIHYATS